MVKDKINIIYAYILIYEAIFYNTFDMITKFKFKF